ncbi:MAG: hypothetical protein U5N85_20630 [Arcicella sp.]|nr:hypothetical protein [Arcicella sp.]
MEVIHHIIGLMKKDCIKKSLLEHWKQRFPHAAAIIFSQSLSYLTIKFKRKFETWLIGLFG